ncbi:ABC transporter substrate-binding protein [Rhodoferax saidenbachensis]|uniref:Thiamine transport system substrate-binding protein n=1 Tax=Rhodoferax saidenbachensis TaxID=1484693 RepID=A0ABU1ZS26_9BURK|nr:ABC transporter substrate-binding protein [Rhodoferax saidenbachensis]MDR7308357.1 putative thiamine transport system substrate-binding protein [Rhodoferax saidenbachensis]
MNITRRHLLALSTSSFAAPAFAQTTPAWSAIEAKAKGQTVYFNAWGGAETINAYIQWAAGEVEKRFGVKVEHVKVTDTADVVKRVRNEKAAGKANGTVDLVWINGENFLTMKREGLLFGPFAEGLPSYALVDVHGKPTTRLDFSEPTEGLEAPWGMAQLTFMADSKRTPKPPRSLAELLAFAKANPGRVTYPRPPNFHGTTFLKQLLVDSSEYRSTFYKPVAMESFAKATTPLWATLDQLHPHLWRAGKQFPQNAEAMRQMLADGELQLALTFNPNDAANEIAANRLPASVTSYQFNSGTIGNTHFVAIPVNASAKEGAQVFANFLLSAEAQARKADIAVWGDPTVLALDKLSNAERARFAAKPLPGQVEKSAPAIPEPHGSWVEPIEKEWARRYGA